MADLAQVQVGTTTYNLKDSTARSSVESVKLIAVDIPANSATSKTYTSADNAAFANVTANHVCLNQIIDHTAEITVQTAAGQVTLSCSGGIPKFTLILGVKR